MYYFNLDRSARRSYAKQIYEQLKEKILSGELKYGDMLPSTRELSRELQIARNTILTAYDMLVSDGFADSVPRSGTYVRDGISSGADPGRYTGPAFLNTEQGSTASLTDTAVLPDMISFDSGLPALDLFPRSRWNRGVSKTFLDAPVSALGYDDPQGRPELRTVLCSYLKRTRGINCAPEQVIITSGTKQGLTLAAKCLLDSGSRVWIENPTNANVVKIFSYHTKQIEFFEVDDEGIRPDLFPAGKKPDVIFATPARQFPMGGILPIRRRLELVRFAARTGCYIIEDDYDSEFNYEGPPSGSLFELDGSCVIHTGTFSKVLYPSLRLGYLVVPPELVKPLRELKRLADHHSDSISQLALASFIGEGHLERHIRRMKKEYRRRRDTLTELLDNGFPGSVRISGSKAGMHIVAGFDGVSFDDGLLGTLYAQGIYVVPVRTHSFNGSDHRGQIIMGYAQLPDERMLQGVTILRSILKDSV